MPGTLYFCHTEIGLRKVSPAGEIETLHSLDFCNSVQSLHTANSEHSSTLLIYDNSQASLRNASLAAMFMLPVSNGRPSDPVTVKKNIRFANGIACLPQIERDDYFCFVSQSIPPVVSPFHFSQSTGEFHCRCSFHFSNCRACETGNRYRVAGGIAG